MIGFEWGFEEQYLLCGWLTWRDFSHTTRRTGRGGGSVSGCMNDYRRFLRVGRTFMVDIKSQRAVEVENWSRDAAA